MKYQVGDQVMLWYCGKTYEGKVVKTRKTYAHLEIRVRFTNSRGNVREYWRTPREIRKVEAS